MVAAITPKVPVLFVDQSGEPGGAELALLNLAQHIGELCMVVVMNHGEFPKMLSRAGIKHVILPMSTSVQNVRRESGLGTALLALPGIIRSTRRLVQMAANAKVVYANTQKAFVIGAIAAWIARRPIIWHLHDILTEAHFNRSSIKLVVWLSRRLASRVITNSRATANALIAAGGDAERIEIIWNGIDPKPFESVTNADASAARSSLGLCEVPVVGLFGRLAPWKGQHVLLDAMRELRTVHALIVGESLYGEKNYVAALKRRIEDYGLADRVHFLGFRTDVPLLMHAVDVVVHTSTAPEPFGRVIVEGMLSGRPVIATAGGGPEEIIQNGLSGIIIPPEDSRSLAAAIRSLLEATPRRERMVSIAKDRAHEFFSLTSMLSRTDEVICRVGRSS